MTFSTYDVRKIGHLSQEIDLDLNFISHTKIISKLIMCLNLKHNYKTKKNRTKSLRSRARQKIPRGAIKNPTHKRKN